MSELYESIEKLARHLQKHVNELRRKNAILTERVEKAEEFAEAINDSACRFESMHADVIDRIENLELWRKSFVYPKTPVPGCLNEAEPMTKRQRLEIQYAPDRTPVTLDPQTLGQAATAGTTYIGCDHEWNDTVPERCSRCGATR